MTHSQRLYPFRNLAAAGNEVPILLEATPPTFLQYHWRKLLPAFPKANLKSVGEGLQNDAPIVTTAAMECIPEAKHSIHPDIMYKVQLKSSIVEIGVSCPKHLNVGSEASTLILVWLRWIWPERVEGIILLRTRANCLTHCEKSGMSLGGRVELSCKNLSLGSKTCPVVHSTWTTLEKSSGFKHLWVNSMTSNGHLQLWTGTCKSITKNSCFKILLCP